MKRTGFKQKRTKPMKRTGFKKKAGSMLRRTALRKISKSPTALMKKEIQAVLREIVIKRDGGCFLRNYKDRITPQYRECGGYRKDGGLILQAEHLHTRSSAASFSDSRIVVCACQRHHIFYKPQHSVEYNELAREFIGEKNAKIWDRVRTDYRAHKVDLALELVGLRQELKNLSEE